MTLSDTIADMITRIRNAAKTQKMEVRINHSNICQGIAAVLKNEGYIQDFERIEDGRQGILRVILRYDLNGQCVIKDIKRISKPGCRIYASMDKLPNVLGGMGTVIVSTSKGVMSDKNCRQSNVGGEILCMVS